MLVREVNDEKISLCLIFILIMLFVCSCTQIAKDAYIECSQCGADLNITTDSDDYPPRYSDDNSICPDCVVKDVLAWIESDYVCIDREDWEKFEAQYGYTEAFDAVEKGHVAFTSPSYYNIKEWLNED